VFYHGEHRGHGGPERTLQAHNASHAAAMRRAGRPAAPADVRRVDSSVSLVRQVNPGCSC